MSRPTPHSSDLLPGDLRLLHDLAVLHRWLDGDRPPAATRLDRALGADFARSLRASLLDASARAA